MAHWEGNESTAVLRDERGSVVGVVTKLTAPLAWLALFATGGPGLAQMGVQLAADAMPELRRQVEANVKVYRGAA